ncbi:MAG: hypothetical protein QME52_01605 [Bacteroidota bacterium]|nr:hypothetical protein [Bacteroidota bacterium]
MVKRHIIVALFFAVFLLSGIASADVIKSGSLRAFSDGIHVTLRWVSDDELNVVRYEILRSSSLDNGYITIASIDPKGPSAYEFIDNSAFAKGTTVYYYRIKVKFPKEESYYPALNEKPLTVHHNVSGVRRTWGSIKAMFR